MAKRSFTINTQKKHRLVRGRMGKNAQKNAWDVLSLFSTGLKGIRKISAEPLRFFVVDRAQKYLISFFGLCM